VISGGSSQGDHDATAEVLGKIAGGVLTHGLALKPGKPTILAYHKDTSTVLLGLPGHPVAALMVFELLMGWAWRRLTGQQEPLAHPAVMATNVPGAPGRTSCIPVKLSVNEGALVAEPIFGKSGMITTLTKADGYVMIDRNNEGLKKGESVFVLPLYL
jgi:molybdopterin molybdotransferase